MTEQDAFKAAEKRGYSKGYAAGQRRKAKALTDERRAAVKRAFQQRAFLAVLPFAFEQSTWTRKVKGKDQPINSLDDRVQLAWDIANEALASGVRRGVV